MLILSLGPDRFYPCPVFSYVFYFFILLVSIRMNEIKNYSAFQVKEKKFFHYVLFRVSMVINFVSSIGT